MSEQEQLIQNVIDAPDDDAPRLAYAAWLDRQGPSAHAELIRVQCELARTDEGQQSKRRTQLQRREKELLDSPEFVRMYWYPAMASEFVRGFIATVDYGPVRSDDPANQHSSKPSHDWRPHRDKILTVNFQFGPDEPLPCPEYIRAVLNQDWWRRVRRLEFFECEPSAEFIEILAASPHLTNLRELQMLEIKTPIASIHKLVQAASIRGLTVLYLSSNFAGDDETPTAETADDPRLNAFIVQIAELPKIELLEELILDFWKAGLGKEGAMALLQSPHLKKLRKLSVNVAQAIPPDLRARLRDRFPDVYLVGHGTRMDD